MILACLQIYRELLLLATFLQVYSNSKDVSYLSWQNTYPNLKTISHIKLNFFLWTKLLKNVLLAKDLTSVTAPLKLVKGFINLVTYLSLKTYSGLCIVHWHFTKFITPKLELYILRRVWHFKSNVAHQKLFPRKVTWANPWRHLETPFIKG